MQASPRSPRPTPAEEVQPESSKIVSHALSREMPCEIGPRRGDSWTVARPPRLRPWPPRRNWNAVPSCSLQGLNFRIQRLQASKGPVRERHLAATGPATRQFRFRSSSAQSNERIRSILCLSAKEGIDTLSLLGWRQNLRHGSRT